MTYNSGMQVEEAAEQLVALVEGMIEERKEAVVVEEELVVDSHHHALSRGLSRAAFACGWASESSLRLLSGHRHG